jgi:2-phosphoglycerate kinase
MAKTIVVKQEEGDRAPFLRGILINSLVQKGISFDIAYSVAQTVRDELRDIDEISGVHLRERVANLLDTGFGPGYRHVYEANPEERDQEVFVKTASRRAPFSVGIISHCLESCAIPRDTAQKGARLIYETLKAEGQKEIGHIALRRIIYETLMRHGEGSGARRYLSWRRFQSSAEPLILLIGGVAGTGKRLVTTEVAYRMDIVRTQSTIMMREIIRSYLAPHVVPTLEYSSFEAWRGLPTIRGRKRKKTGNAVITGFMSQFGNVKMALQASVNRAINEAQSLIVDGVLVLPWELDLKELDKRSIVVPVMLAAMRKKNLLKRLKQRDLEQRHRSSGHYSQHLDDIWELQSYLLTQADRASIPIIPDSDVETTIREVLELISHKLMERYPPDPEALDIEAPVSQANGHES